MAEYFKHACKTCGEPVTTNPKTKRYDHVKAVFKQADFDHAVTAVNVEKLGVA